MITTTQILLKKSIPFDADNITEYFDTKGLNVLRWAVTGVTETDYIIDAAIIVKNN